MRSLVAAILLAASGAAWAAPMTNDDVIKMVKGGLADATVIQAIEAGEPGFDTSPDGLVALKQGGVSDAVIQRILARGGAKPAAQPAAAPAPQPAAAPVACPQCGTVTGIREIDKPGQGTGVGAVAGGVIGGVLGRSIGGRDHRTAGTVVGAVGGAVAGHHIEKRARSGKTWEVGVRFDDGSARVFHMDSHPSLNPSDRVRVVNGVLTRI
jgi:outer membrane lipoprotein SlyB